MRQPLSLVRRLSGALLLGLSLTAWRGRRWRTRPGAGASPRPGSSASSQGLWPAAKARGVSRATFDEAFRGVEPDAKIVALTKKQSEFVRPIWDYINGAISAQRLDARPQDGGRMVEDLWPPSSAPMGCPRSRARRLGHGDQFRQLHRLDLCGAGARDPGLYRLSRRVLQGGAAHRARRSWKPDHIDRAKMLGSWAGAMGQTQFMPSSFMKYAVDGNRDGRAGYLDARCRTRSPRPPITCASTAGSRACPGASRWRCRRVSISATFAAGFRQLAALGVCAASTARPMPRAGEASAVSARRRARAGVPGHRQLRRDQELQLVGCLCAWASRIWATGSSAGGRSQGAWPKDEPMLDKDQRQELQKRLAGLGPLYGRRRRQARLQDPRGACGTSSCSAA